MNLEPRRWRDDPNDAPSGFAEAGEAYRSQAPSPEQMQHMLLAAQAAQLSSAPWWLSKWLWLSVGTLAVVGSFYLASESQRRPHRQAQSVVPVPGVEAVHEPAPEAKAPVQQPLVATQPQHPTVKATRRPQRTVKAPAEPEVTVLPAALEPNPAQEFAMLKRARGLLAAAKPAEALALMDQLGVQFPQGMFVQERELLAVEALAQLGRPVETHTRAAAFLLAHPRSVHAARVRRLDNTQTR